MCAGTGSVKNNVDSGKHRQLRKAVHAFMGNSHSQTLGARKTVLEATTAKMKTIQERYYLPNNSVLVITGDVKAEEIFARADALFATPRKPWCPEIF